MSGPHYLGIPIEVSEHAVSRTWVYPTERFWQYEPSKETEDWCRYFGIGHERVEPAVFQIRGLYGVGDVWVVHPTIFAALEKEGRVQ